MVIESGFFISETLSCNTDIYFMVNKGKVKILVKDFFGFDICFSAESFCVVRFSLLKLLVFDFLLNICEISHCCEDANIKHCGGTSRVLKIYMYFTMLHK